MIVYTCPKCGGHLQFSTVATYPPISVTECFSCGWREEKMNGIEEIPYKTTTAAGDVAWSNDDEYLSKDELYTKADMVAMLTDIQLDIEELKTDYDKNLTSEHGIYCAYDKSSRIVQNYINALKENTDGKNID